MSTLGADNDNRFKALIVKPAGKAVLMLPTKKELSKKELKTKRWVNVGPCEVVAAKTNGPCPSTGSYVCPECGLHCCGRHALYKDRLKGEVPKPFCPKCAEMAK